MSLSESSSSVVCPTANKLEQPQRNSAGRRWSSQPAKLPERRGTTARHQSSRGQVYSGRGQQCPVRLPEAQERECRAFSQNFSMTVQYKTTGSHIPTNSRVFGSAALLRGPRVWRRAAVLPHRKAAGILLSPALPPQGCGGEGEVGRGKNILANANGVCHVQRGRYGDHAN